MNHNTHGELQYKKALIKYQKSLLPTSTRSLKIGKFEDVTDEVLEGLNSDTDEEEEQDQ